MVFFATHYFNKHNTNATFLILISHSSCGGLLTVDKLRDAPRSARWIWGVLRVQGLNPFFTFMGSGSALWRWRTELLAVPSLSAINGCNLYPSKALAVFKFHLFYPNEWWTPGTVHCAAILIYIRGLHPSLNQGTTSICYLNDKQQLQEWSRETGRRRKGGQTNSDFNPGKTQGPEPSV